MGAAENAVVRACMDQLTLLGVPHIRNNTGAQLIPGTATTRRRFVKFGTTGWPDIIGVLPDGKFLGVECKAPDKLWGRKRKTGLSPEQQKVRYQLLSHHALWITAKSGQEMVSDLKSEGYFQDC
jgi:hypothetical protein